MSVAMNGPITTVFINQLDGTKNGNGVILTTTEFASLMFQLKAIEHSFVRLSLASVKQNLFQL